MKNFHADYKPTSKTFNAKTLPKLATVGYSFSAVLNQIASREKLNILTLANSTPFYRAFFVRSFRTPKENAMRVILSMVARNGQPFAVGCFPMLAVSHPVTLYRPTVRSLAVVPKCLTLELFKMLYKFLCVHRNQPTYTETTISVNAPNLNEARWALPSDYRLLIERPIASLPNGAGVADFCAKPTACDLPNGENQTTICGTTNQSGSRSRYTSGIFLPQILQNGNGALTHTQSQAEFVVRATLRNKAEFIRTNNEGCSLAVVEPLPHPTKVGNSLLKTKEKNPMKPQSLNGNTAQALSVRNALTSISVMGVANA